MENYEKYRWFLTSSGNLAVSGKNEEQNEELVPQFIGKSNTIMHTSEPGSPFSILINPATKQDIDETAVFCASFSQQWKQRKKKAEVHIFSATSVKKSRGMKTGTFGVSKFQTKSAELKLKLAIQNERLRAIPIQTKPDREIPIILTPGTISKQKAAELIKQRLDELGFNINKEEIEQAIPAGGFSIR